MSKFFEVLEWRMIMSDEEKLEFIENLLGLPMYSLKEETNLSDIETWNLDTMVDFQNELLDYGKDISIEELQECERVVELLRLID